MSVFRRSMFFCFKQKTAYEMRISDWSSDVCSSDLFGYGLSYTDFAYRNLKVTGGATLTVSVDVTNTGTRAGADVPQLYVGHGDTPMRLAGFRRRSEERRVGKECVSSCRSRGSP